MIISQTPLRISFVGGGTDLKEYWEAEEGKVLSSAIDKYVYVIIKQRFDDMIYLNYSEKVITDDIYKIPHDLIRESMIKTGINEGVEITTLADIPSEGSGLGSSSSITVGLLNAMYAYTGEQVTAERLAQEACEIEIDILKKPMGKQDQYIAAFGGLREIIFRRDGTVDINKISISNSKKLHFGSNMLLFYTNITRKSDTILTQQKNNIPENLDVLEKLKSYVPVVKNILENGLPLSKFGYTLNDAWMEKCKLSDKITNDVIDNMYKKAISTGALGGKISGAGGGGFLLLYIPRENQNLVREELSEFKELPFMLESDGSKIIFNIKREYWK
ncbi:GHMP kinase [Candidatus Marinimicrobia bacterium MT.SAG.4]|nr:GHMP kinase [Candidatus Marinimicrobia bacterium MT.SAG.4]